MWKRQSDGASGALRWPCPQREAPCPARAPRPSATNGAFCNLRAQADGSATSNSSRLRGGGVGGRSQSPPPSAGDGTHPSLRPRTRPSRPCQSEGGDGPGSLPFGAARLPRALEARQRHKVLLEARVGRPQPLPLPLRGEEGVLEPHAGGRRLHGPNRCERKASWC